MESSKNNFIWKPLTVGLLLAAPRPEILPSVAAYAQEHSMVEKPEFHISIIGHANGKKITDAWGGNDEIIQRIRDAADDFSWHVEYLSEYSLLEKFYDQEEMKKSGYENIPEHTRRTIIQAVRVADMVPFYEKLSEITGIAFDVPSTHITLFSWSDYAPMMTAGIGLYSHDDLLKYRKETL